MEKRKKCDREKRGNWTQNEGGKVGDRMLRLFTLAGGKNISFLKQKEQKNRTREVNRQAMIPIKRVREG